MSKKSNLIITKSNPSASIITISQLIRFDCLLNLYELIKLQTYTNITEWVIVEGSKNKEDGNKNKDNITNLIKIHLDLLEINPTFTHSHIKIIYIEYSGLPLSELRNLGNNTCSGNIIVCMDDDDYYFKERVSHAIEMLEKSPFLIAGCSNIYMYEYCIGKLYKFKGFNKNHSTNNCMAFKKEYLCHHKHEDGLIMAEEKSFTNGFSEPMVQLNPLKCIIVSSHNFNTFNKRELCVGGTIGINASLKEVNNHPITDYIPSIIFNKMKSLFYKEEKSPYDIVYFCGGLRANKWNPINNLLEQEVVDLCEHWVNNGKTVAIYADILLDKITEKIIHNKVEYKNWKSFEFNHCYDTVILWRTYGLFCGLPFDLKSKNIFWDLPDDFINQKDMFKIYNTYEYKITKLLFKNDCHKDDFEKCLGRTLNDDKILYKKDLNVI
jgi:hypothetical protein